MPTSTAHRNRAAAAGHLASRPAIDDTRIREIKELAPPAHLLREFPASDRAANTTCETRQAIHRVLHGADDRLLVVVGPCSIHDYDAAIDYATRLSAVKRELAADLIVVMRVYFEKPRSTVGWKGLINDPHLDDSYRINEGLRLARRILVEINELELPAGTEYLDMITPQYIADLIAWGAIGARTTESQVHRELASGLSCPVGFKNGTDGDVRIAVDAIKAASAPHHFLSVTKGGHSAIVHTAGNEDCHIILRGGTEPNFDAASVEATCRELAGAGLAARLMIDCSHANSQQAARAAGRRRARRCRADRGRRRADLRRRCSRATSIPAGRISFPAGISSTASRSPTPASAGTRPSRFSNSSRRAVRERRLRVVGRHLTRVLRPPHPRGRRDRAQAGSRSHRGRAGSRARAPSRRRRVRNARRMRTARVTSTYYDTPEFALEEARVALRVRRDGARFVADRERPAAPRGDAARSTPTTSTNGGLHGRESIPRGSPKRRGTSCSRAHGSRAGSRRLFTTDVVRRTLPLAFADGTTAVLRDRRRGDPHASSGGPPRPARRDRDRDRSRRRRRRVRPRARAHGRLAPRGRRRRARQHAATRWCTAGRESWRRARSRGLRGVRAGRPGGGCASFDRAGCLRIRSPPMPPVSSPTAIPNGCTRCASAPAGCARACR